jgi:hypothetical protein
MNGLISISISILCFLTCLFIIIAVLIYLRKLPESILSMLPIKFVTFIENLNTKYEPDDPDPDDSNDPVPDDSNDPVPDDSSVPVPNVNRQPCGLSDFNANMGYITNGICGYNIADPCKALHTYVANDNVCKLDSDIINESVTASVIARLKKEADDTKAQLDAAKTEQERSDDAIRVAAIQELGVNRDEKHRQNVLDENIAAKAEYDLVNKQDCEGKYNKFYSGCKSWPNAPKEETMKFNITKEPSKIGKACPVDKVRPCKNYIEPITTTWTGGNQSSYIPVYLSPGSTVDYSQAAQQARNYGYSTSGNGYSSSGYS